MQIIYDICDKNLPNALANRFNQARPASQLKFHILSFESECSESHISQQKSAKRMHKQITNYRGVKLDKVTCQQITAEIMQTYDLSKFAIELSNGSTLLKIPPYKTT